MVSLKSDFLGHNWLHISRNCAPYHGNYEIWKRAWILYLHVIWCKTNYSFLKWCDPFRIVWHNFICLGVWNRMRLSVFNYDSVNRHDYVCKLCDFKHTGSLLHLLTCSQIGVYICLFYTKCICINKIACWLKNIWNKLFIHVHVRMPILY